MHRLRAHLTAHVHLHVTHGVDSSTAAALQWHSQPAIRRTTADAHARERLGQFAPHVVFDFFAQLAIAAFGTRRTALAEFIIGFRQLLLFDRMCAVMVKTAVLPASLAAIVGRES